MAAAGSGSHEVAIVIEPIVEFARISRDMPLDSALLQRRQLERVDAEVDGVNDPDRVLVGVGVRPDPARRPPVSFCNHVHVLIEGVASPYIDFLLGQRLCTERQIVRHPD